MNQETYSVAALAASVGVPRTTINDWLVRYEDYIDSVQIGKRKVYSSQSLAVLQAVARLRDEGRSSAEIEAALASEHGVKPEVTENVPPQDATAKQDSLQDDVAAAAENETAPLLPAVKEFEKSAMELTGFIAELRKQHQRSVRRSRWVIVLMVLLILMLLAAAGMAYKIMQDQLRSQQAEAARLAENMQQMHRDFTAELQTQSAARAAERQQAERIQAKLASDAAAETARLRDELLKMHEERSLMVAKLQQQLEAERKAFAEAMAQRESELLKRSEAEREQLLRQMQSDAQRSEARLNELQAQLEVAARSLSALNDNLQRMQTPAAAEPAVVPAAAAPESAAPAAVAQPDTSNPPEEL